MGDGDNNKQKRRKQTNSLCASQHARRLLSGAALFSPDLISCLCFVPQTASGRINVGSQAYDSGEARDDSPLRDSQRVESLDETIKENQDGGGTIGWIYSNQLVMAACSTITPPLIISFWIHLFFFNLTAQKKILGFCKICLNLDVSDGTFHVSDHETKMI